MSKKIDRFEIKSDKRGLKGLLEKLLRRYRTSMYLFLYSFVVVICLSCVVISLFPIMMIFLFVSDFIASFSLLFQSAIYSLLITFGLFGAGVNLLFVTAFFNWLNPFEIKPWRGNWYSTEGIPWFYHNALFFLVRYSFLDFITPSPLAIFYLKMMGMKIGKGVLINTSNISDPCLITLEDHVTVGGGASMMAHYGQHGVLILARTHIKKGAMIGFKSTIFGDVVVGENYAVAPHEVVLPKSRLGC